MSHHNKDIYPEHNTIQIRAELALHGLASDKPSQASDCFRFGYMAAMNNKSHEELIADLKDVIELDLSNREDCERVMKELIENNS